MKDDQIAGKFPDENDWPFLGRLRELDICLRFLNPEDTRAQSRLLHIAGESGCGKSFFAKELICRFSRSVPESLCLYVNTEASEYESVDLEKRLTALASYPSRATRLDPQQVPKGASLARYMRPQPFWLKASWTLIGRVLGRLPFLGKFIEDILPPTLPASAKRQLATARHIWDYLIATAHDRPVLVVIDNIQFLASSIAVELDTTLAISDYGLRLVVVERLMEAENPKLLLRCFPEHRCSVVLRSLDRDDTYRLVQTISGRHDIDIREITEIIFEKSQGNAKQIWLQLRALRGDRTLRPEHNCRNYEEAIHMLPRLDRLALQSVSLLAGGIKVDDIVRILHWIVKPLSEEAVRKTIRDLTIIGLLIINSGGNNRVRTEHELVDISIRHITTEDEAIDLRENMISALDHILRQTIDDDERDRLVDRMVGLISPQDLRSRHDLLAHLIYLIDRERRKERFHYLVSLYATPCCHEVVDLLPSFCLEALLDAFQKTSQFNQGLAAIELIRKQRPDSHRLLNLFTAKYLVQQFDYNGAEALLKHMSPGPDRDVILFNILLNLCRDDEARKMLAELPIDTQHLSEFQCVMLRNAAHLYSADVARELLLRAKEGFKYQGLKFGEATTLNNLGVLELWAGNLHEAGKHLSTARATLQALSSSEIYQPITNMAVLHAISGRLVLAKEELQEARAWASPYLRMDDLMLRLDHLVLNLMEGTMNGATGALETIDLYKRSLQTKDLRFQRVMGWFAGQMETAFMGTSLIPDSSTYERDVRLNGCVGHEVYCPIDIDGRRVTAVLQLSTHWRY